MNIKDWREKKTEHVEDILKISKEQGDVDVKLEGVPTTILISSHATCRGFGLIDEKLYFTWNWPDYRGNVWASVDIKKAHENNEKIILGGVYTQEGFLDVKYIKTKIAERLIKY